MSKRVVVRGLLVEAGERGVTTGELLRAGAGSRYGGRIFELRAQGYQIETERIRDGEYRYTLRGCPAPPAPADDVDDVRSPIGESVEPLPLFEPPPTPLNAALADYEDAA